MTSSQRNLTRGKAEILTRYLPGGEGFRGDRDSHSCIQRAAIRYELYGANVDILRDFRRAIELATEEYVTLLTVSKTMFPYRYSLVAGAVAAFGSREERLRFAEVPRIRFCHDEDRVFQPSANGCQLFQSLLRDAPDLAAAARIIADSELDTAPRELIENWAQIGVIAQAFVAGDEARLNNALETMLRYHKHQSLRGELKYRSESSIAILPLGICRLARLRDMRITVESPYLPLELLDEPAAPASTTPTSSPSAGG